MKNENDNNTKEITHLSLCSGYEGIGLGLRRVFPGLREIAYVEREGFAAANLVAKMETGELDAAPVFTDVKTFPYGKFYGCVDILSGGFPCQPFSSAGKRAGVEDPRHLFPYIAEGIRRCQPKLVFLENVEGIISAKTAEGESVLQYVLRTLEDLDYTATAGIFSASEVGAPHQRKRVFILGHSKELFGDGGNNYTRSSKQSKKVSKSRNSSREELGDPGLLGQKGEKQQTAGIEQPSEELGYSTSKRGKGKSSSTKSKRKRLSGLVDDSSLRFTSETKRPELDDSNLSHEQRRGFSCGIYKKHYNTYSSSCWPARPEEGQYDWEEPRTTPKPELGGAANGASSRVDRLRLLGNGVVPQTAAKAFVVLMNRILTKRDEK